MHAYYETTRAKQVNARPLLVGPHSDNDLRSGAYIKVDKWHAFLTGNLDNPIRARLPDAQLILMKVFDEEARISCDDLGQFVLFIYLYQLETLD